MLLSLSDIIQILGIIVSATVSVTAVVISVKSLRQSTKAYIASTRPYIVVYGTRFDFGTLNYGLVLKNFGKTAAVITRFECDCDLREISESKEHIPFEHILGTTIVPDQSILTFVDRMKVFTKYQTITFHIEYATERQSYSETFVLNCDAETDYASKRNTTQDKELQTISCTLQEIAERLI